MLKPKPPSCKIMARDRAAMKKVIAEWRAEPDPEFKAMRRKDVRDFEAILRNIAAGRCQAAQDVAFRIDTEPRESIPVGIWRALGGRGAGDPPSPTCEPAKRFSR